MTDKRPVPEHRHQPAHPRLEAIGKALRVTLGPPAPLPPEIDDLLKRLAKPEE